MLITMVELDDVTTSYEATCERWQHTRKQDGWDGIDVRHRMDNK